MPSPKQIITQLHSVLSKLDSRFNSVLPVESASVSGKDLTLTITGHSLVVGQELLINGAYIRNKITDVQLAEKALIFTTEDEHDLTAYMQERITRNWPPGIEVTIENLDTYELDPNNPGVPSRTTFQTKQEDSAPDVPVLSGDEYLLENRALGLNGKQKIQSKTDDTITVDLDYFGEVPPIPDGPVIVDEVITGLRIGSAPNVERAQKIYTQQSSQDAYLFLIMDDRISNKSRTSNDDLVMPMEDNTIKLLNIIEQFSILVFIPTSDSLTGIDAEELAYGEIFDDLLTCLYGWESVSYVDDGKSIYNTSFYAHAYDFQARKRIDYENGWKNSSTVAFRNLNYEQTIFDEGDSDASIDLSDQS